MVLPVAEVRGGGTDQGMLVEEEVVVSGVDSVNVSKKYCVFLCRIVLRRYRTCADFLSVEGVGYVPNMIVL